MANDAHVPAIQRVPELVKITPATPGTTLDLAPFSLAPVLPLMSTSGATLPSSTRPGAIPSHGRISKTFSVFVFVHYALGLEQHRATSPGSTRSLPLHRCTPSLDLLHSDRPRLP